MELASCYISYQKSKFHMLLRSQINLIEVDCPDLENREYLHPPKEPNLSPDFFNGIVERLRREPKAAINRTTNGFL